jgi:hypothetical protein
MGAVEGRHGEPGQGASPGRALIEVLVRWQDAGAVWRVVDRHEDQVSVALLRCDGGEEVDRLTSGDAAWLAFLDGEKGSEDG